MMQIENAEFMGSTNKLKIDHSNENLWQTKLYLVEDYGEQRMFDERSVGKMLKFCCSSSAVWIYCTAEKE